MDNEQLEEITRAMRGVAEAITAPASPGNDASGGVIYSLTESVMGITAGLFRIAESIDNLAEAVRQRDESFEYRH